VSSLRTGIFALVAGVLTAAPIFGCGGDGGSTTGERARADGTPAKAPRRPADERVTVTRGSGQRMWGWGASVVTDVDADPLVVSEGLSPAQVRRLDRLVFRAGRINLVRVFGPGIGRLAGNVTAAALEPAKLAFMRRARQYGVRFMLTGADAPPTMKQGMALAAGQEGAYAAFLGGLLASAKSAGVPFAYAAIANEPSHFKSALQMTSDQAAAVYQALARELREGRLTTKVVLGDDVEWGASQRYAQSAYQRDGVRQRAPVVASHDYGGNSATRRALGAFARQTGLSVWQTEWGSGCATCGDDRSIDSGLEWSARIAASLVEARAGAWFAFRPVALSTHGPADGLLVRRDGARAAPFYATKRFHVFRHYATAGPPGSRRVPIRISSHGLLGVGFRRGERVSVVLTNPAARSVSVDLALGAARGRLRIWRTSARENYKLVRRANYAGSPARLILPGKSVTSAILGGSR
jgi:glycosyl hydrolase family 30